MALIKTREYSARVNTGGNFCGHRVDAPKLDIAPTTEARRPRIIIELQQRVRQYYNSPSRIPSLNSANASARQQRSERREACLQMLAVILEYTDLASLRCGIPTAKGFVSLTLNYLASKTGLGIRRAERAIADLKKANLLSVVQPRNLVNGVYQGLAAIKAVNKLLFSAFGLSHWLKHERDKASKRLAKRLQKGPQRNGLARTQLALGITKRSSSKSISSPVINDALIRLRLDLVLALRLQYPTWTADRINSEADAIITSKTKTRS